MRKWRLWQPIIANFSFPFRGSRCIKDPSNTTAARERWSDISHVNNDSSFVLIIIINVRFIASHCPFAMDEERRRCELYAAIIGGYRAVTIQCRWNLASIGRSAQWHAPSQSWINRRRSILDRIRCILDMLKNSKYRRHGNAANNQHPECFPSYGIMNDERENRYRNR